jgi:hypothetical protein
MTDLTPDLQFLLGEPLNAVSFVMDYVELHFNGSYLRCLVPPVVERGGGVARFPEPGSRDALCAQIGAEVRAIRAADGGELRSCGVTRARGPRLAGGPAFPQSTERRDAVLVKRRRELPPERGVVADGRSSEGAAPPLHWLQPLRS